MEEKKHNNKKSERTGDERKVKLSTIIYSILILIAAYLIVIAILIYGFKMDNKVIRKTSQIIPYPAALINYTRVITYDELKSDLDAIKQFYTSQNFSSLGLKVDFNSVDGQKRLEVKEKELLNKLIENKIIEMLARQRGISITSAMVAAQVNNKIAQYGNSDTNVLDNLKRLYGWNLNDFENQIVKPDLYREALSQKFRDTDQSSIAAKKKIEAAQAALKNGQNFGEVAKQYSEGASAKNGGELGWFSANQMLPEVAAAAFIMNKGGTSDVIESSIGYHIINIEDKRTENGADQVKIRQIFVRTESFSDWLLAQEKNVKIFIPLKEFYWDSGTAQVKFRDQQMTNFENNLSKNSPDDASMLF